MIRQKRSNSLVNIILIVGQLSNYTDSQANTGLLNIIYPKICNKSPFLRLLRLSSLNYLEQSETFHFQPYDHLADYELKFKSLSLIRVRFSQRVGVESKYSRVQVLAHDSITALEKTFLRIGGNPDKASFSYFCKCVDGFDIADATKLRLRANILNKRIS